MSTLKELLLDAKAIVTTSGIVIPTISEQIAAAAEAAGLRVMVYHKGEYNRRRNTVNQNDGMWIGRQQSASPEAIDAALAKLVQ